MKRIIVGLFVVAAAAIFPATVTEGSRESTTENAPQMVIPLQRETEHRGRIKGTGTDSRGLFIAFEDGTVVRGDWGEVVEVQGFVRMN